MGDILGPYVMVPKSPIKIVDLSCTWKLLYWQFKYDCLCIWSLCPHRICHTYAAEANCRGGTNPAPFRRETVNLVPMEIWKKKTGLDINFFHAEMPQYHLGDALHQLYWGYTKSSLQLSVFSATKAWYLCCFQTVYRPLPCGSRGKMPWMVTQKNLHELAVPATALLVQHFCVVKGMSKKCRNFCYMLKPVSIFKARNLDLEASLQKVLTTKQNKTVGELLLLFQVRSSNRL